ncbi:MAG: hypothetical protein AB8G77_24170 [Rhodothermales bacterium]
MTLNTVLLSLLEQVEADGGVTVVNWDRVQQWPADTLRTMMEVGMLTPTSSAQSIECRECENRCFMGVRLRPGTNNRPSRAFIVCEDPDMQDQMGPIEIPLERLQQWTVTAFQLARFVAALLAIDFKADDRHGQTSLRIGMQKGKKGRRWLSLNKSPLALEVNGYHLSLEEVLYFEDDILNIDKARIERLLDKPSSHSQKIYTPSIEKRKARKQDTEAMYEDWREAYRTLRREHPDTVRHSDSWISRQIEKLDVAQGRDSETIRKNMKK